MKYHNKYIISLYNCLCLSVHNSVGIFLLNTISSQCLRILSIVFLVKHSLILENISHCIPRGFSKNIVMLILYLLSCGTLYMYIYDTPKCAHYSSTYCAVLFFLLAFYISPKTTSQKSAKSAESGHHRERAKSD